MRLFFTVCFLFTLLSAAFTQPSAENLFKSVKPEATIQVRKHSTGADLVEITLLDSQYPPDVLKSQVLRLGAELHSDPRGLAIGRVDLSPNSGGDFVRADFAVDGLSDPAHGIYRLGPLARALAGGPPGHQIHGIMVVFEQQAPGPDTVEQYGLEAGAPVSVAGEYEPGQIGLEYRIQLNTQDPSKIYIPDKNSPKAAPAATQVSVSGSAQPWFLYGSVTLFALAIGALVYSLTLRNTGPKPPRTPKKHSTGTSRFR